MNYNYGNSVVPPRSTPVATGENNDLDIGKGSVIRLIDTGGGSPAADYYISGFNGGEAGRTIRVWNRSSFNATIRHSSTNSSAANRINLSGAYPAGDIVLRPYRFIDFYWDDIASRWFPMLNGQGAWRSSSSGKNIVRVSANYTALPDDEIIEVDLAAAGATFAVSLNDAGDQPHGQMVTVKLVTENSGIAFSVGAAGAATVEQPPAWSTDFIPPTPGQAATWYYNATDTTWYLINPSISGS